jgi:hypothetical protein
MNPLECILFTGTALSVAGAWTLPRLFSQENQRLRWFFASWFLVLLIMDLSGAVRGEVGRIWMFLVWPTSIIAAVGLARREDGAQLVPLLVFLQVLQTLAMKYYLTIYSIL